MLSSSAGLFELDDLTQGEVVPTVCLSFGMGLDSACLLLRWLEEPATRDFDLSELVVVTAHTGDEYEATRVAVERHILPRLAEHSVRFVQTARTQRLTTASGEGVTILDDSTSPQRLFFRSGYRLSDEMLSQGTIPQRGGFRSCSIHAKGNCLDPVIAQLTQGRPYRHAIGFEANERGRALKDSLHNTGLRTGWYPLQDWGFTRQDCQDYVTALVGEPWQKSCCGYCPFSMTNIAGRQSVIERYRHEPTDRCLPILLDAELRCDHYGDSCQCVGNLLYRAACLHCTFEGTIRDSENAASEDAQDHCFPGWRDLPIVAQVPEYGSGASGKKAMTNWIAKVETLYPTGWLQEGGPIRTRRTAPGTRHVPLRTPFGGYDMCGEITPNKTRTTTPTTSQEER